MQIPHAKPEIQSLRQARRLSYDMNLVKSLAVRGRWPGGFIRCL
jgi:hypothetical protein